MATARRGRAAATSRDGLRDARGAAVFRPSPRRGMPAAPSVCWSPGVSRHGGAERFAEVALLRGAVQYFGHSPFSIDGMQGNRPQWIGRHSLGRWRYGLGGGSRSPGTIPEPASICNRFASSRNWTGSDCSGHGVPCRGWSSQPMANGRRLRARWATVRLDGYKGGRRDLSGPASMQSPQPSPLTNERHSGGTDGRVRCSAMSAWNGFRLTIRLPSLSI